jgi:hypothetical protein
VESPGRPRKDAWVLKLEQRLRSDERIGTALADRLIKIALKGRDGDALRAIQEVQDRIGGPLKLRVDGLSEDDIRNRLGRMLQALVRRLPPEFHQAISDAAREGFLDEEDFG